MHIRVAAGAATLAVAMAWGVPQAQAQITVNLHPGDFTYQFADPVTGLPITTLAIPVVGNTAKVAVYLIQNNDPASTPQNLIQQLGAEGLGVRLNYSGAFAQVPNNLNSNISQRPPPTNNPNGVSSDYTLVSRYGSGTGSVTTTSAAISDGLANSNDPLPFPGDGNEDPLHNSLRMLIGTFTFQGLAMGTQTVTAVSGPATGGINNISGPNPTITGLRSDGTNGPLPGNGTQGEVQIDQFLATTAPTLSVVVGVPEPSTLALGSLAAFGLAAWRRRRNTVAVAA